MVSVISSTVCQWMNPLTQPQAPSFISDRGKKVPPPVEACDNAMCSALQSYYLAWTDSRLLFARQRCQLLPEIYLRAVFRNSRAKSHLRVTESKERFDKKRSQKRTAAWVILRRCQIMASIFSKCCVGMRCIGSSTTIFPFIPPLKEQELPVQCGPGEWFVSIRL